MVRVILFVLFLLVLVLVVPSGGVLSLGVGYIVCLSFSSLNVCFVGVVAVVSFVVFSWRGLYVGGGGSRVLFDLSVVSFIVSMFLFLLAEDLITLYLGFELLGFTSVFLVLFYLNQKAVFSSTLVLLMGVGSGVLLA